MGVILAMKTIALISQKGGSGKSTLTVHMAVMAGNSRIIDLDPQGSSRFWFELRKAETPTLVSCGHRDLSVALGQAARDGIEWAFIDTAPHDGVAATTALKEADLSLIPMRPTCFDFAAITTTTVHANRVGRPYAVVLNAAPVGRGIAEGSTTVDARKALDSIGAPYLDAMVSHRVALSQAVTAGLSVTEFDPVGKASLEIRMLWLEVQSMLLLGGQRHAQAS
jgi:chromosome partitioning protein